MIGLTNRKAKQRWQREMDRMMTNLERGQARTLKPILNKQYINAANRVTRGDFSGVISAINKEVPRIHQNLLTQYKRVAAVFGDRAFNIIDDTLLKGTFPQETKAGTPKEEFWKEMNTWNSRQAKDIAIKVNNTAKKNIIGVVAQGMKDELSHRDIAKNIRKTGAVTTPWKALRIARTETHTSAVRSVDASVSSTGIKMKKEWAATVDERVRVSHLAMNTKDPIPQDKPFIVGGEKLMYPGDPSGSAGNIINCLTSYKTAIYTNKGWKRVKDIKVNDLVLTHKNRFRKVLRLFSDTYSGKVVDVVLKGQGKKITVTPEHPFLMSDGTWKNAVDINKGDTVMFMAGYCQYCGKLIPYYKKYCNRSCGSKVSAKAQWSDPKHRANVSKKAKAQMHREYKNGTRDKNKIVEKARAVCKEKYGKKGYLGVVAKDPVFREKIKQGVINKYGSYLDMLKKFAFPACGKCGYEGSRLEQVMAKFLDKNNRKYVRQFWVGRRRPDFYLEDEKLFIEVDGYPFHEDKVKERKRDLEILTKYPDHKIAHVDYKPNPPTWEFFDLLALNHTGTFSNVDMKVKEVKVRELKEQIKIYNFAVEGDESYIAKGFITHNCRCVLVYHPVRGAGSKPVDKPSRSPITKPKKKPDNSVKKLGSTEKQWLGLMREAEAIPKKAGQVAARAEINAAVLDSKKTEVDLFFWKSRQKELKGALSYSLEGNKHLRIRRMGSIEKGTGEKLLKEVVSSAKEGNKTLILDALPEAKDYWVRRGFKLKKGTTHTFTAKPRDVVFSKSLKKDTRVKIMKYHLQKSKQ